MSLSVFIKNACSTTGEGCFWEESSQSLLYVDTGVGEVHRYNTIIRNDSEIKLDGTTGFVIPRKSGGYVVGLNNTLTYVDWKNITAKPILQIDQSGTTRLKNGRCDVSGRLWTATTAKETHSSFNSNQGVLYSMESNKSLYVRDHPFSAPNGPAWSTDHTVMYIVESISKLIYAYDFHMTDGDICNKRLVADFGNFGDDFGIPEGICVDEFDKLWIACSKPGKVIRFSPDTGNVLQTISFPTTIVTSCCFGGSNFSELYVTSGRTGLSQEELTKYPSSGSVFKISDLQTKGFLSPVFEG